MKTTVINNANESMKAVRTDLRSANKEYTSISRVLKDIQRKELLDCGYKKVFDALHLEPAKGKDKVEPKQFFDALTPEMWGQTYSKAGEPVGEKWVGLWGISAKKDKAGNKVLDAAGNVVTEPVLRKVTAWTPTKLFKVWAQSEAFRAAAAAAKK